MSLSSRRLLAALLSVLALSASTVGCGLAQTIAVVVATRDGGGGGVTSQPAAPPVAVVQPVARSVASVTVTYLVIDSSSTPASVAVELSTDGGASFQTATRDSRGGEGTTDLETSPGGTAHDFLWDAPRDLPPGAQIGVRVRVRASSPAGDGPASVSGPFIAGNDPPALEVTAIPGPIVGFAQITTIVSDSTSDPAALDVEWAIGSGPFLPITVLAGEVLGLSTSPIGVPHSLVWNTLNDVGSRAGGGVRLRAVARDEFASGAPVVIQGLAVSSTAAPVALIRPIPSPSSGASTVDVPYTLFDVESDDATIVVELLVAGEAALRLVAQPPAAGTTGLGTSPLGVDHVFALPIPVDLRDGLPHRMRVRITPSDAARGTAGEGALVIGARPPSASISTPAGTQRGLVVVDFTLASETSEPVTSSLDVLTDPDGRGFALRSAATIAVGSLADLPSTPSGSAYRVAWNAFADLGLFSGEVELRLTPRTSLEGSAVTTGAFRVEVTRQPVTVVTSPAAGAVLTDSPVAIQVLAVDPEGLPISLAPQFSLDGTTFVDARTVPGGGTLTGLATSAEGVAHSFAWDARADLGPVDAPTVSFRAIPTNAVGPGLAAVIGPFEVDLNSVPQATVSSPGALLRTSPIDIDYRLFDLEGDLADIAARVSFDGGASFGPATLAAGAPEGVSGLSTAGGRSHVFRWDAAGDLVAAGMGTSSTEVVFEVVPHQGSSPRRGLGAAARTSAFAVDLTVVVVVPPSIAVDPVPGVRTGPVAITYRIADPGLASYSVAVAFSLDGSTPAAPATPAPGSETTTALDSSARGALHLFVWDSGLDAPGILTSSAAVRISLLGAAASTVTAAFTIDNRAPVPPTPTPTPTLITLSAAVANPGTSAGEVPISYTLTASSAATVAARVEYSTGGAFLPATAAAGSEALGALAATPSGTAHAFVWASAVDLPRLTHPVTLRVTPRLVEDGSPASVSFTVANDVPPTISIDPVAGIRSGVVPITFRISDLNRGTHSIAARFSLGSTAMAASATAGAGSETSSLASSPSGTAHAFNWDSGRDAPGILTSSAAVTLSLVGAGAAVATVALTIDNRVLADLAIGQPSLFQGDVDPYGLHLSAPSGATRAAGLALGRPGGVPFLLAADPGNHRVLVFDPLSGASLEPASLVLGQADAFGHAPNRGGAAGLDTLSTPLGIATDGSTIAVADRDNDRVLVWDAVPTSSASIAASRAIRGFVAPEGVWFGPDGRLYVADTGAGAVHVFASASAPSPSFSLTKGANGTSLSEPCGGALLSSDQLAVAVRGSGRVEVWDLPPTSSVPASFSLDGTAVLTATTGFVNEPASGAGFAGTSVSLSAAADGLILLPSDGDEFDVPGAPDASRWTESDAGTFTVSGGELIVSTASGGSDLEFNAAFAGDFDARITLTDLQFNMPLLSELKLYLGASEQGGGQDLEVGVEVTRSAGPTQTKFTADTENPNQHRQQALSPTPMVLRIRRKGDDFTIFEPDGATELLTVTNATSNGFKISIRRDMSGLLGTSATVELDHFSVLSSSGAFAASGTYTSPVFDLGAASLDTLRFERAADLGTGGTSLSLRVAASASAVGPFTFLGPDGTGGTAYDSAGAVSPVAAAVQGLRFARYEASFRGGGAGSPVLAKVALETIAPGHTSPGFVSPSAVFESSGRVVVADGGNHRLLVFSSPLTPASEPGAAVGGTSLDETRAGTSASLLRAPGGGAGDVGLLAISDAGNNRVLLGTDLSLADEAVLGQGSFLGRAPDRGLVDAARCGRPLGVSVGLLSGDRFRVAVADALSHRVLVWSLDPQGFLVPADEVLGPSSFESLEPGVGTASRVTGLDAPEGVWDDGSAIWVADTGNNRVLRFPDGGVSADLVLGQADFAGREAGGSPAQLSSPCGVSVDSGKVYVADRGNGRVQIWDLSSVSSGVGAAAFVSVVAPEAVWAGAAPGIAQSFIVADAASGEVGIYDAPSLTVQTRLGGLVEPSGVSVAGGRLFVAERGRNRVAVWDPFPEMDDAPPTFVIGQPTPAGALPSEGGVSPASLFLGRGPFEGGAASGVAAIDTPSGLRLFVVDPGNARVTRYTLPR